MTEPTHIKIKDKEFLYRDIHSKAVLSVNVNQLTEYEKRSKALQAKQDEVEQLKEKVDKLEALLLEILGKMK